MWELTKSYKMAVIRIISRETSRYQDTASQLGPTRLRHLVVGEKCMCNVHVQCAFT